jgi:hypothetical protein
VVAEDVRRVSANGATATIIGAILAGTFGIIGVLAGLFAERFLRSRGEVRCVTGPVQWTFRYRAGPTGEGRSRRMNGLGPIHRGDVAQAASVLYRFDADFYNGRDLPTGLRSFEVLFHRPDDVPMSHRDPGDGRTLREANDVVVASRIDALKVLNLPPKQLVSLEVRGSVPDPARLEGCNRVELRAAFPDGTAFSHELARVDPSVVLAG